MEQYQKQIDYCSQALSISQELEEQSLIAQCLDCIGYGNSFLGNYDKAINYLEKSLSIQQEIGLGDNELLETTAILFLCYKRLTMKYDDKKIHKFSLCVLFVQQFY